MNLRDEENERLLEEGEVIAEWEKERNRIAAIRKKEGRMNKFVGATSTICLSIPFCLFLGWVGAVSLVITVPAGLWIHKNLKEDMNFYFPIPDPPDRLLECGK